MANITLVIPDAELPRVIAALCASDMANPLTPTGPNAKAVVVKWVINCVKAYEVRLAQQALVPTDTTGLIT